LHQLRVFDRRQMGGATQGKRAGGQADFGDPEPGECRCVGVAARDRGRRAHVRPCDGLYLRARRERDAARGRGAGAQCRRQPDRVPGRRDLECAGPDRAAGGAASAASDLPVPVLRAERRTDLLRHRYRRPVPARSIIRGPHPQRYQAGRAAGAGADQIRAGDQSEDRQGARARDSVVPAAARRRGDRMRRREFVTLIGGAAASALSWPLVARAQQRVHVVGLLAPQPLPPIERFVRRLRDYGYVDGQNLRFVRRFSEGQDDSFPAMAAELTALPVDMIVTWGTPAAVAAKQATSSIPVVMGAIGDPVSGGLVSNLARPGGNITGFAAQNVDLEGKRLELLKDLLPQLSRVGMLANVANPMVDASMRNLRTTAEQLRINFDIFDVRSNGEIEAALQRINNARPDGVLIASDLL